MNRKNRRLLANLVTFGLIPVFYSGPILYKLGHPVLGVVIGVPAALIAWPTMFAIAAGLDEQAKEKEEQF